MINLLLKVDDNMETNEYRITIASIFIFFLIIAALTLFPLLDALIATLVLVYLMRPINNILIKYGLLKLI